ncbi:MAG: exodeoxyribonuclease III [Candidatus Omnitrophica bacterium]|nr:exodeoxyribonuclease III [Candidatus Omnitrophota bacterium]
MRYRLLSWNVNGIRAVEKKGFFQWLYREKPDILALQEIKARPEQLGPQLKSPKGYFSYWNSAEKKGYSGVAVYSRKKAKKVVYGLGNKQLDSEGRTLILEYPEFTLFNIYFPNGKMGPDRLRFKMDFYEWFYEYLQDKKTKKPRVVCGDFNTAHKEIDLSRPKENSMVSGFLPEERFWLDRLVDNGFCDTFREFDKSDGNYTWWDYKSRARERNVGWRIDYFFIEKRYVGNLKDAYILKDVPGSDHCPIGITLKF